MLLSAAQIFASRLQQKAHHHCMVFKCSQRGFLLSKISFSTRCGQSPLLKFGNSLVLLRYALLAICDELEKQRTSCFVA
jgi:hypothetical protein